VGKTVECGTKLVVSPVCWTMEEVEAFLMVWAPYLSTSTSRDGRWTWHHWEAKGGERAGWRVYGELQE
jgi:hypothetical protein